jgi:hypothetical protein
MDGFIKLGGAHTFQIGPFLDDTDGKTAETGLTIAATAVYLSKQGGSLTQKNEATAMTGTSDALGYYDCVLDGTDTGTVGTLKVHVHVAGALPVWSTFQVVPAIVYDSLFAAAGTDYLPVDMVQYLGTAAHAASENGTACVEVVRWGGNDVAATAVNGVPKVDVANISGDSTAADNCESFFDGTGYAGTNNVIPTVTTTGTATAVTTLNGIANDVITAASINTGALTADAFAADAIIAATLATGAITADAFAANAITASAIADASIDAATFAADVDAEIATMVWNAATLSYGSAGSYGKLVEDNLNAPVATIDTVVDGIATTLGAAGAGLTAVPWNAAWDAEVQSEVFDALNDAYTDATGLTANGLLERIRVLSWILRNKITVTDANGNTVIYKDNSTDAAFTVNAMLTDDSTTTTRLRAA